MHVCVFRPGGEVAWRRTEDTAGARRPWTGEADLPGSFYAHSADFRVCVMGTRGAEAGDSLFFACWIALKTCKIWFLIWFLPTPSWAPLGRLLNLSEPLLPHMHEDLPQVSVKNK